MHSHVASFGTTVARVASRSNTSANSPSIACSPAYPSLTVNLTLKLRVTTPGAS